MQTPPSKWRKTSNTDRLPIHADQQSRDHLPTPRRCLSPEKYTVGRISALPLELAAAQAMLDETHDGCGSSPGDNNSYTLGRMAGHNCVIACLPAGIYSTTSATRVASDMRSSFPTIAFWLMVGIGGAPSPKADIRLGDVVVSVPSPGKPAVVQYDYGKTVADGKLELTGMLNNPPTLLLTTISKIKANHLQHRNQYLHRISDMIQRYPDMADKYSYLGQDQDILFNSEYEHLHGHDTCEKCDRDQVLTRPPRDNRCPVIHYGTIASGNQVMKHAKTRDRFTQELGVLCFEMEASGLMNDFPSLAIPGICDYSDSHKNGWWQGYAAAIAAVYAKELLLLVSPPDNVSLTSITSKELIEKRKLCIDSLGFGQMQTRKDTIKYAHAETCKWLQEHPTYQHWLDTSKIPEHHGFLWIKGKPGTGKSTIMKHAFDYSQRTLKGNGTVIISFFFNARGEDLEKSTQECTALCYYNFTSLFPKSKEFSTPLNNPVRSILMNLYGVSLYCKVYSFQPSRRSDSKQ